MKKDIVKYNNYMNTLSLGNLKQSELDMLMAICSRMRELGTNEVNFGFGEIREMANLKNCDSRERFASAVSSLSKKLISIYGHIDNEEEESFFTLFSELSAKKRNGTLTVTVNPKYAFVLNDLSANFTMFELQEFVALRSKYSKNLYRLLKQFESSHWRRFEAEDLREKLGCPKSYLNKVFVRDVLNPSVDELKTIFCGLTVEVTRSRRRGAPITGYEFRWKTAVNDDLPGQMDLNEVKMPGATGKRPISQASYDNEKAKASSDNKKTTNMSKTTYDKIHNFNERKYDYDELAQDLIGGVNDGKNAQADS